MPEYLKDKAQVIPALTDWVSGIDDPAGTPVVRNFSITDLRDLIFESGSFTPVLEGSSTAGVGTYSVQAGHYNRIRNRCFFDMRVVWSAHTGTGNLRITGLPFASAAWTGGDAAFAVYPANLAHGSGFIVVAHLFNNSSTLLLALAPTAGGAVSGIGMPTSGDLTISGSYRV